MVGRDHRKRVSDPENSAATPKNKTARVLAKNQGDASEVARKSTSPMHSTSSNHQPTLAEPNGNPAADCIFLMHEKVIKSEPAEPAANDDVKHLNQNATTDEQSLPEFASKVDLSQRVSPLSEVHLGEALITLSKLTKKYCLSDTGSEEFVRLFCSLAPHTAIDPSLDLLKVAESQIPEFPSPKMQIVCPECKIPCSEGLCCTPKCKKSRYQSYGIENDISAILKDLFENHGLAKLIEESSDRLRNQKQNANLKDVTDGLRFSTLPKESKYDISFIFHTAFQQYTPAITTFISVLSIAELEPSLRKELAILSNIWRFPSISDFESYLLSNLYETMENLSTKGIDWTHPYTKAKINSKVFLLCCSVDQVLRNQMQKVVDAGLELDYCCSFCEKSTFEDFSVDDTKWELRNHSNVNQHAYKVAFGRVKIESEKGVMGFSPLSFVVPHFDIVNGFSAEYVSNLLNTVVKISLFWVNKALLLDQETKSLVALKLDKISGQRPSYLEKGHSSLDNFTFWNSKEHRDWLLFYSVPCLEGVWPSKFLEHHCLLVKGVYNLLKDEVRPADLEQSKKLLAEYCRRSKELHGENVDSDDAYELHLLQHLVQNVQQCGPLWSTSAFPINWVFNFVKSKYSSLGTERSTEYRLKLLAEDLNRLTTLQIFNAKVRPKVDCVLIGETLSQQEAVPPAFMKFNLAAATFYPKATIKGFSLESFHLQKSSRSSYFLFNQTGAQQAAKLICFFKDKEGKIFFLAKKVVLLESVFQSEAVTLDHLRLFEEFDSFFAEPVHKIDRPLFLVDKYLCIPPNIQELHIE